MKSFRINGVILKRRNFLEKDRILTIFSKEEGKVEALAKGARRPGNRLSPNSDLGTVANYYIHKTKSLDIITEINPIYHPFGARGEFEKTQKISYALKVIDKLFELGESHQKTYYSLIALIESVSSDQRQLIFLKFLLEVMDDLGALPSLMSCATCQKQISSKDEFAFSLEDGLCHRDCIEENMSEISDQEVKLLRLVATLPIGEVISYKAPQEVFNKTYRLITKYFNWEFGNILPDEVM